jgi:hypothetical protein
MRLAAMVDLVLEQVQQRAIGPLRLHARAAVHTDDPVWPGFIQRLSPGDQSTIDRRLGGPQVRDRRKGNWIRPRSRAERATLERIDIEPVDDQDVVQGGLDRREKPRSRRFELRLCSIRHRKRASDGSPRRCCTPSRAGSEGVRQASGPPPPRRHHTFAGQRGSSRNVVGSTSSRTTDCA